MGYSGYAPSQKFGIVGSCRHPDNPLDAHNGALLLPASVKVLIVSRPAAGVGPQDLADHLAAEAAELRVLRERGVLLEAYSPGGPGAVLILEAEDAAAAATLFEALPLPRAGLIHGEIVELHPLTF
jgi:hypothetical protein